MTLNKKGNKRGMNDKSQSNLHPNRNGRLPAKISLISLTKRELARVPTMEEDGFDGQGMPNAYWIARQAVKDARIGDKASRTEVWERVEGKVTQPIAGEGGGPVVLKVVYDDGSERKN